MLKFLEHPKRVPPEGVIECVHGAFHIQSIRDTDIAVSNPESFHPLSICSAQTHLWGGGTLLKLLSTDADMILPLE